MAPKAEKAAKAPVEKRIDPADGESYTLEEMSKFYKGTYNKAAVKSYFDNCKAPEPKAKAKAKAKAKVKAEAKEKKPRPVKVIKVGDKFPDMEMHLGFPPDKINMLERLADKKVIILGLPGAFTPC